MTVQLLICRMFLGFVQNSMHHPCVVPILIFLKSFWKVQVVQSYNNNNDMATVLKNFPSILSKRSNFYRVNNLSLAVHAFSMCMLILL